MTLSLVDFDFPPIFLSDTSPPPGDLPEELQLKNLQIDNKRINSMMAMDESTMVMGRINDATVRKRVRKKDIENGRWANLPTELLEIISKNLNIADYLRFGEVCRSWRSFFSEYKQNFMASQSPLILNISKNAGQSCDFVELDSGIRYKRQQFKFYRTPKFSDSVRICKDRAIFASIGSQDQDQDFASIGSQDQDQDFALVILSDSKASLELYTSREDQWKDYSYTGKHWRILDMIVFDGSIYVVTIDNKIGIFNVRSLVVKFLNLKSAPSLSWRIRLVVSNDQLFVVDFITLCPVKVYRIDFSTMEWVGVKDLGGQALFIDLRGERCFKLMKSGGRSNHVYVLSDYECKIYPFNDAEHTTFLSCKWKFRAKTYCWYFVDTSNSIDNIRDD
ncbi:uncharacterized protein LOC123226237 [Mangifera indica]|uniref:uncharacterized protein LOC123226237 n=1 Tax=Mangifera indica TaxID=29780 RepID=UPI001CFA0FCF|nr:uncharacterized protein LOC123226237 [Mangifera indica]